MEQNEFKTGTAFPFVTTDAILANCLRIAGVTELPISPRNVYSHEILFKAGGGQKDGEKVVRTSRYSGMEPIPGARAAWKDGVRGRVEYHFEHSPEIAYFVEAYRDQEAKIKAEDGDKDAGEAIREIMHVAAEGNEAGNKMDEREALLRILCIALKLRIGYVNRWKEVVPMWLALNPGGTKSGVGPRGGEMRTNPGGKLVPVNASDELLRSMDLL